MRNMRVCDPHRSQEMAVSCVYSFRGVQDLHEYHELAKSTRCPLYTLMKQWILQTYGKAASEQEDFSETDEGSLFIATFSIFTGAKIFMLFQSMIVAGSFSTIFLDPAKSKAPNHEGRFPTRSASGSS